MIKKRNFIHIVVLLYCWILSTTTKWSSYQFCFVFSSCCSLLPLCSIFSPFFHVQRCNLVMHLLYCIYISIYIYIHLPWVVGVKKLVVTLSHWLFILLRCLTLCITFIQNYVKGGVINFVALTQKNELFKILFIFTTSVSWFQCLEVQHAWMEDHSLMWFCKWKIVLRYLVRIYI